MSRRATFLGGWVVTACVLASCSVTHSTLDASKVSAEISSQLVARYPVSSPTVTCPTGVPDTAGQTFVCTTTLDGQLVHIDGTVTKGGQFTPVPREAIIVISQQAAQLTQEIEKKAHSSAVVQCPSPAIRVVPVGQTLVCTVQFPAQKARSVTVKVIDAKGDFGYTVAASH